MSSRTYAAEVAPDDVRDTLLWLEGHGYRLVSARGSREEMMGNVALTYEQRRRITLTRDRGQWEIRVAPTPGGPELRLDVLDAARRGQDWDPGPARPELPPAARQLPVGLSWHVTLPAVLAWLDQPGAEEEALAAGVRASELLRRRFARRHGKA